MAKAISWFLSFIITAFAVKLSFDDMSAFFAGDEKPKLSSRQIERRDLDRALLIKYLSKHLGVSENDFRLASNRESKNADKDTFTLVLNSDKADCKSLFSIVEMLSSLLRYERIMNVYCSNCDRKDLRSIVIIPDQLLELLFESTLADQLEQAQEGTTGDAASTLGQWRRYLLRKMHERVYLSCVQNPQKAIPLVDYMILSQEIDHAVNPNDCDALKAMAKNPATSGARNAEIARHAGKLLCPEEDSKKSSGAAGDIAPRSSGAAGHTEPKGAGIPSHTAESPGTRSDITAEVEYVNGHLPDDWFRTRLIAYIHERSGALDKAREIRRLGFTGEIWCRRVLIGLAIIFAVTTIGMLLALARANTDLALRQERLSVASAAPYGVHKTFTVLGGTLFFSIGGLVALAISMPQMFGASGTIIACFEPVKYALCSAAQMIILFVPVIALVYFVVGCPAQLPFREFIRLDFGNQGFSFKQMIFLGLRIFAVAWFFGMVGILLSLWLHHPRDEYVSPVSTILMETGNLPAKLILVASMAIIGPVLEEILFRGILYTALRRTWGIGPSIIVSSMLFSLLHGQGAPWLLIGKFTVGALNAFALEKTRSIVPGIVAHIANNTVVITLLCLLSLAK
ncbi:MAG TPA: type II CAAX endopeptidase family protein [Candidatus Obscuribacterales bacterium]